MNSQILECLALTLVPGLGTTRILGLLKRYGSAGEILRLPAAELRRLNLSAEIRDCLSTGYARRLAEETVRVAEKKGIRIICLFDPEYPWLLKQIYDPPLVLYAVGDLACASRPSVAVVGSRRCSVYGREVTEKLARELAQLGINVISGLARGIDSCAHKGALAGGGSTVAVLGNGVDVVYPRENRRLYERIRDQGCLLSEFPLGSFPAPQNFPVRNRIISGLCYGTLISEAGEFSGSLITARLTLEQNRELWAVPGNITSPGSYGPNYLIKQGAHCTLTVQDIVDQLPLQVLQALKRELSPCPAQNPPAVSPLEEKVLSALPCDSALPFDRLLERLSLEVSQLSQALLSLEIKGFVAQHPGRRFSRRLS